MNRTEALQALGPTPLFRDSREQDLQITKWRLEQCEQQLTVTLTPDDAEQQQMLFWGRLAEVTQACFLHFQESGYDADIIAELPDDWLDQSATQDPQFGAWLETVYISWGEHVLPDIIAEFVDGEAEMLVEQAFTDMIYDFPRMQILTEVTFLHQKMRRLETEQQTWFPHRPVRRGSANEKERIMSALQIPSLFQDQADWLQKIRKIKFDVIPEDHAIPATVDNISTKPVFLVVHLFSGRRLFIELAELLRPFVAHPVKPFQLRDAADQQNIKALLTLSGPALSGVRNIFWVLKVLPSKSLNNWRKGRNSFSRGSLRQPGLCSLVDFT
ncbi:unnamed protein product [Cladocopium goreaui]|uniref:Uncharacterized protein n=1 Tax=Cladocopium goreaui TaxID=2562237 RepID=A0A9P1CGR1_9DINO|nr:unnamed protein product [Cladocopium goreaui]